MAASDKAHDETAQAADAQAIGRQLDLRADASHWLASLRRAAQRPPCIVLLGESNAGKTTLANRLIGDGLLPTSVIANTRFPLLVRHDDCISVNAVTTACEFLPLDTGAMPDPARIAMIEVGLPSHHLLDYEILDTPAEMPLSAIWELPRIGPLRLPVWCTNATQAWKESERRAWLAMGQARRRRGVLAVTRLDRVLDDEQRRRLTERLERETGHLFAAMVPATGNTGTDSAAELAERCRAMHARRKRTVDRLSARIVELTNSVLVGEGSSRLAVLGLKKSKPS